MSRAARKPAGEKKQAGTTGLFPSKRDAQRVIVPLLLPLDEPLVPAPALGVVELGELVSDGVLEGLRFMSTLLEELRSAPVALLELESRLGGFTVMSVLLEEDDGSVLEPADELPGVVVVVVVEEELECSAGGVTVVVDEETPGRVEEPVVAFRLSPQALRVAATAATIATFAKFRKVLSI